MCKRSSLVVYELALSLFVEGRLAKCIKPSHSHSQVNNISCETQNRLTDCQLIVLIK